MTNRRKPMSLLPMVLALAFLAVASACRRGIIVVTEPLSGTTPAGGSQMTMQWHVTNVLNDVKIDITLDNGNSFTNLVPVVSAVAGSQQVTIPNPQHTINQQAFLRVTSLDDPSVHGDSDKFNVTAMSTRYLTFAEATAAGAQFPDNADFNSCRQIGQVDGTLDNYKYAALPRGVLYTVDCTNLLSTGGKANPESFKNLKLHNGWKIKDVQVYQGEHSGNSGGEFITKPQIGSDDPYTQYKIWADRGGRQDFVVAIMIEGPADTSPVS